MKFIKPSITELIICAAGVAVVTGMFLPAYLRMRTFDRLEDRAKKAITAAELQVWATSVLANPPASPNPRVSDFGTNFPKALLDLDEYKPYISIRPVADSSPGMVTLMWGSGFLGHCGFDIGDTNFARGDAWQPGVYFWKSP